MEVAVHLLRPEVAVAVLRPALWKVGYKCANVETDRRDERA